MSFNFALVSLMIELLEPGRGRWNTELDQLELVVVQRSDDLRRPLLTEHGQLVLKIDRVVFGHLYLIR